MAQFRWYVDNQPPFLGLSAYCIDSNATDSYCTIQLPPLSPGTHTLKLDQVMGDAENPAIRQSLPSDPIDVPIDEPRSLRILAEFTITR